MITANNARLQNSRISKILSEIDEMILKAIENDQFYIDLSNADRKYQDDTVEKILKDYGYEITCARYEGDNAYIISWD